MTEKVGFDYVLLGVSGGNIFCNDCQEAITVFPWLHKCAKPAGRGGGRSDPLQGEKHVRPRTARSRRPRAK